MSKFGYYDIVEILSTAHTAALGVSGTRGVILGISEGDTKTQYGVLIGDETYMLDIPDLRRTGERVDSKDFYEGESIQLPPERYPKDE
jgi:hypothetical protein